jgi:hypothetical protein
MTDTCPQTTEQEQFFYTLAPDSSEKSGITSEEAEEKILKSLTGTTDKDEIEIRGLILGAADYKERKKLLKIYVIFKEKLLHEQIIGTDDRDRVDALERKVREWEECHKALT